MRLRGIFGASFLDGFTTAGFLQRLSRPGEYTRLLEPPVEQHAWSPWVFEIGAGSDARVALSGDLHRVPEAALQEMLQVLERETESRRAKSMSSVQGLHSTS